MKPILILFFFAMYNISLPAQQTVTSTGGNAAGSGGTVSFSVGQVAYTTGTGTNGSVAQGVQQPYEISVITTLEEAKDLTLQWSAYPNPAGDFLKLSLLNSENSGLKVENLSYQLYDLYGKLLLNNKLDGKESTLIMENLSSGTYILKIIERQGSKAQKELKTFKIIKH